MACLKVVCLKWSNQAEDSATTMMVDRYIALEHAQEHTIFHVRLGLCVIDLINEKHGLRQLTRIVEHSALQAADAYAAQEVLSHQRPLPLTTEGSQVLADVLRASGLGEGTMPEGLQDDLIVSTRASEESITDALAKSRR